VLRSRFSPRPIATLDLEPGPGPDTPRPLPWLPCLAISWSALTESATIAIRIRFRDLPRTWASARAQVNGNVAVFIVAKEDTTCPYRRCCSRF